MANPGYPMQPGPHGPPMMGGPQGPMGQPPPPMRRGTSKAVPVVVSAGLAVGVFCGLLFGLGTGKDDAQAAASTGSDAKHEATKPAPVPDKPVAPSPAPPIVPAGSGSGSAMVASGSGSGSAAPAAPTPPAAKTAKLIVAITPEAAAATAKIKVDGKDITGNTVELPATTKSAKVSITATGYHSEDKVVEITPDADTKLDIELRKRAIAPDPGTPVPPRPPPKKKPGGDLIDL